MTNITCTIHGNSTVTPTFKDCPWCVESDRDHLKAVAQTLADALERTRHSNCNQLDHRRGEFHIDDPCPVVAKISAALTTYHDAVKGDG